MAIATGFTFPSSGDASNATNDLVNNFTILKDSVNNITADQITDGVVTNAKIASSGILSAKLKGAATTDEDLGDMLENYIQGCWLSRNSDTQLKVSAGTLVGPNGEWRRITSALTNSPTLTTNTWTDVYADFDATASTFVLEVIPNQATPGASTATATSSRLIGSIFADATTDLNYTINYRQDKIVGWTWKVGSAAVAMSIAVTHGRTFTDPNDIYIIAQSLGARTTASGNPASIVDFNTDGNIAHVIFATDITATTFNLDSRTEAGTTFVNSRNFGYVWVAHGRYA